MNFLITGVAGFVGSTLAQKLIHSGHHVVGVDNLSYGRVERLDGLDRNFEFYECDVLDIEKKMASIAPKIDIVIHCAAIAPLPENQKNFYKCIHENVAICASLSNFCTKWGVKDVIFFSSGAVYEGSGDRAAKEHDDVSPSLIYPTSKYLSEKLFESICRSYDINVSALRLFNLYGPMQDYKRKQPPLIGYLIKSIINEEDITLYASKNAKRDYIYIDDLYVLVENLANKMVEREISGFNIFNAGSGEVYSVYDIYEELCSVAGINCNYKIGDKRNFWSSYPEIFDRAIPLNMEILESEVDKVAIASLEKTEKILNWKPEVSLKNGLENCLKYAKEVLK